MSMKSKLKVLVVGGAGYIGSHVTKALRDSGHHPTVFDNLSTGSRTNLLPNIPFIHGDLLIPDTLLPAVTGMDAVIHLAALKAAGESMNKPEIYSVHNITGTINLLNAVSAAQTPYFVFSSTAAVYGEPQYLPMDEKHPTQPKNYYGQTKLQIESLLQWYDQLKELKYASLRYFNAAGYDVEGEIYGLEQNPNNLLPIVLECIVGWREKVQVFGDNYNTKDGSCIRDYIHVTDLAWGHVMALEYLHNHQKSFTVNLGTANGLSVFEILQVAKELSQVDFPVEVVSQRAGDPAVVLAKTDYAKEILSWETKHSDVHTLIESMIKAYHANIR